MPHESTVEHTGEVFQPTPASALGPRGFSVSEDPPAEGPSKGSSTSLTGAGSSVFGNAASATHLVCSQDLDDDDDDGKDEKQVPKLPNSPCGVDEGVSFTVGGNMCN